ncbi:MAG: hypothetical protein HOP29_06135 [Phycisphaerales bacterium]|nr:hypothetical protein [Phycisphaerales bacterium]
MKRKRIFRTAIVVACSIACHRVRGGEPTPGEGGDPQSIVVRVPGTVDDPTLPRTVITPVLHSDDKAPGIPNASIVTFIRPAIDGAGNVLFWGQFRREGEPFARSALWYGQPGKITPVMYDGMPAPLFPPGVEIGEPSSASCLAENGMLALTVRLRGPGIVAGFNDRVIYVGWPGSLRRGLQGGDQAPGLERGTIIDLTLPFGFGAQISDNGVLMVLAYLSGPEVDDTNDRVMWIGPHGDLKLVWRKGMVAPGTNGARFAWADFIRFNDAEQAVFRAGLVHDHGVDFENDVGHWRIDDGMVTLLARGGDQAAGMPAGVRYFSGGGIPSINAQGDIGYRMLLTGVGITSENDAALWIVRAGSISLVARKGDPVPSVGEGVELTSVSGSHLSESGWWVYRVKYGGSGINDANAWAAYTGSEGNVFETLRDGELANHFDGDVALSGIGVISSVVVANDIGDAITFTGIVGDSISSAENVVFWQRDDLRDDWFPLLRSGMTIGASTWFPESASNVASGYWTMTGGSDGERQSFNDRGKFSIQLDFDDSTKGVYLLNLLWPGDGDGDGDVDLSDFGEFQDCHGMKAVTGCAAYDFDEDGYIDLADYFFFRDAVTEAK